MFGTHFYNETIKRSVSIFGTLFNNITLKKTKEDGTVLSISKVPISYGPKQKFLARLQEETDLMITTEVLFHYQEWHSNLMVLNMTLQDNKTN